MLTDFDYSYDDSIPSAIADLLTRCFKYNFVNFDASQLYNTFSVVQNQ